MNVLLQAGSSPLLHAPAELFDQAQQQQDRLIRAPKLALITSLITSLITTGWRARTARPRRLGDGARARCGSSSFLRRSSRHGQGWCRQRLLR